MTAEERIRMTIESFATAYKSKDLDTLASTYCNDLIKDRAGFPAEGKAETVSRLRQVFSQCDTDIQVTVDEIIVCADLACVRGAFSVTLKPRAADAAKTFSRRYIEIWRNEEGTWRVARTMDNEPV